MLGEHPWWQSPLKQYATQKIHNTEAINIHVSLSKVWILPQLCPIKKRLLKRTKPITEEKENHGMQQTFLTIAAGETRDCGN